MKNQVHIILAGLLALNILSENVEARSVLGDINAAVKKGGKDVNRTAIKAGKDTETTVNKAGKDINRTAIKTGKEASNFAKDVDVWIHTGDCGGDICDTLAEAVEDTVDEIGRAGKYSEDLIHSLGYLVEDQIHSVGDTLSEAEKRVGEGKIVDAIWHLGVDPYRYSSKNIAKAATNSSYLNTALQAGASVSFGPQGAAAYAAWLTYENTKDLELSLKNGIIAGGVSYGFSETSQIPSTIKKVITASTIGGIAVAVNGGNQDDIFAGAFRSAAMVVVQVGYKEYTGKEFDPSPSKGSATCKLSPGADCAPLKVVYKDGKVVMRRMDNKIPHVGSAAKAGETGITLETSKTMTAVSRYPGMNAMAYMHDMWVDDANMSSIANKTTIMPAIAIVYTATGAPVYTLIQKVGLTKYNRKFLKPSVFRSGSDEIVMGKKPTQKSVPVPVKRKSYPSFSTYDLETSKELSKQFKYVRPNLMGVQGTQRQVKGYKYSGKRSAPKDLEKKESELEWPDELKITIPNGLKTTILKD